MSSRAGAFVGSPRGARVMAPRLAFPSGRPINTTAPGARWYAALLAHGGPALDLHVRAQWTAATTAPQIFTSPSGVLSLGGVAPAPSPTPHPCGIAGVGWRMSIGTISPAREVDLLAPAIEVAAAAGGPWYLLGTDHGSSAGNPWGLFLGSATLRGVTSTHFSAWAVNAGRGDEVPVNCVWLSELDWPYPSLTDARYHTIVANPCIAAPDAIYPDWLATWAWFPEFTLRRRNAAGSESGREYRWSRLELFTLDALTTARVASFYDATFDAIGMNLSRRPPHLTHVSVSGRVRIYLGAAPFPP